MWGSLEEEEEWGMEEKIFIAVRKWVFRGNGSGVQEGQG